MAHIFTSLQLSIIGESLFERHTDWVMNGWLICQIFVPYDSAIPWQAAPAAAKAGVDALSQSIAVEFGPAWGIRSNVIAPGMIKDTEGADRLTPKGSEEMATSRIPTQRFGTKDDIANMALFLFSDAGNYCSGAKFVVDGGAAHMQSPWLPYPDSQLDPKGWRNLVVGSRL